MVVRMPADPRATDVPAEPARTLDDVRSIVPPSRWSRLWRPLYALPLAIIAVSLLVALVLPEAERDVTEHVPFVIEGGPEGARSVLSTIASAMISVTGLVFSITIVVMQLASGQFTPRVLATFVRSRVVQSTLGVFIGTFVYALVVLRSVEGGAGGEAFVPKIAVTLALLLVLACVGLFLAFIHEVVTTIQVDLVVVTIGDAAHRAVDDLYPETPGSGPVVEWQRPDAEEPRWLDAGDRSGHVTHVDHERMVRTASAAGAVVEITSGIGDAVVEHQPLARVWGLAEDLRTSEIFAEVSERDGQSVVAAMAGAVGIGDTRSPRHDLALSIRQLVDIAERALSPAVNDPTTAVLVLDQLHRILRPLVGRPTPSPYLVDEQGVVRVVHPVASVESLVALAVEEIAHYGRDSVQVPRRMRAMLDDLLVASRPPLRPALERWRESVHDGEGT